MTDATPGASEPAPGTTGAETHAKPEARDNAERGAQIDGERDAERGAASGDDAMRVDGCEDAEGDRTLDADDDSFNADDESLLDDLHYTSAARERQAQQTRGRKAGGKGQPRGGQEGPSSATNSREGGSNKKKTTNTRQQRGRSTKPPVPKRSSKAGAKGRGGKGSGAINDYFDCKDSDPAKNGSREAKGSGSKTGAQPQNRGRASGPRRIPLAGFTSRMGGIHFPEEQNTAAPQGEQPKTDANPPSAAAAGTARGDAGAQESTVFNKKTVAASRKRARDAENLSESEPCDSETNGSDGVEAVVVQHVHKKGRQAQGVAQRNRGASANEQVSRARRTAGAARAERAGGATPARRAEEGVPSADAEPSDLVEKVNAMQRRIDELERDKLRDIELDTMKNKNIEYMEQQLTDARAKVAGLEAERAANLAITQSTITKHGTSQKGSKNTPSTRKEARAVKHASSKYAEAVERARLPLLQQRILARCDKQVVPYCKWLVRQLDIEEGMVHDGKRVHAWVPEPGRLDGDKAIDKGCNTPGLGPLSFPEHLRDKDEKAHERAPEPPMLCTRHKAMGGGLFGLRDGADNGKHLLRLALIVCTDRASVDTAELVTVHGMPPPMEHLPSGRAASVRAASVLAASLSDDELRAQCEEVCKAAGATKELKIRIGKRIADEASTHKSRVAVHHLNALHFKASRGKIRTSLDVEETAEVVTNWYVFGVPKGQLQTLGTAQLMTIAKQYITAKKLRGWRVKRYHHVCSDPKDKAKLKHKAFEKNKDEVDIFFGNAAARTTYREWTTVTDVCDATPRTVPKLPGDASVLTLARLDAWMATNVLMALQAAPEETGRKQSGSDANDDDVRGTNNMGNVRNTTHNDMFDVLLPRAIEGVLGQIRAKVEAVEPDELCMPFDWKRAKELEQEPRALNALTSSKTDVYGEKGHRGDLHSQAWRKVTSSHFNPFDNRNYVVALPSFISTHVCSWIGEVKDAFIGVSDGEPEYMPILSNNNKWLKPLANAPEDDDVDSEDSSSDESELGATKDDDVESEDESELGARKDEDVEHEDESELGAKGGGGATGSIGSPSASNKTSRRTSPRKKRGKTQENVPQSQEDGRGSRRTSPRKKRGKTGECGSQ